MPSLLVWKEKLTVLFISPTHRPVGSGLHGLAVWPWAENCTSLGLLLHRDPYGANGTAFWEAPLACGAAAAWWLLES